MEIMAIKLSDHIIIKRGSRPNPLSKYEIYDLNSNNNAIPYPIQSDINKNSLMLNKYKKMFKINLGFKFEPAIKGDLLLSSSCDIGNAVILDLEKAFIDDKFFNVKTSPNLSKKYLQYWLLKNKKEISELGHGTTFKVLYLEPFKKYIDKIFLPNLDEQQQIINIIEPFERLKENLNKKILFINDIAQDIIKTVSCRKKICELASVTAGQSPPQISKYWTNANIPFLNINNLTNNIYILSTKNFINELAFKSYRCKKTTNYSILVGKVSPDKNKISVVNKGFVVNGAIRILEPLNIKNYGQIFESIRNESYKLSKIACGSVQQQINSNQLLNLEINFNIKFNIFFNIQLEYKKIQVRILDKIDKIIKLLIQINIK